MKLISLNIWGGKVYKLLIRFINQNKDVDIFCFQEVFSTISDTTEDGGYRVNIYQELSHILKHHKGYFAHCQDNYIVGSFGKTFTKYPLSSGQAIFIRKSLEVFSQGSFFIFGTRSSYGVNNTYSMPRNAQYLSFKINNKNYTVCNLHGIWTKTKTDTPERIKQFKKIKRFLGKQDGAKILCGDFNIDINTKGLKIFEDNMMNLIKKYKITSTRSNLHKAPVKFADYILTSRDIKVKDFKVLNDQVSDHLPLYLEFS